jgi:hypothetical protein
MKYALQRGGTFLLLVRHKEEDCQIIKQLLGRVNPSNFPGIGKGHLSPFLRNDEHDCIGTLRDSDSGPVPCPEEAGKIDVPREGKMAGSLRNPAITNYNGTVVQG